MDGAYFARTGTLPPGFGNEQSGFAPPEPQELAVAAGNHSVAIANEAQRCVTKWRILPFFSDNEARTEQGVGYFEMGSPFDSAVESAKHMAEASALR
ncbi:hypothetical protein CO731_03117 [Aminobacter sp. MSH1]|nr:hypothetical protein CO731_03117 [Aminobacter sp. MSH1]